MDENIFDWKELRKMFKYDLKHAAYPWLDFGEWLVHNCEPPILKKDPNSRRAPNIEIENKLKRKLKDE